MNDTYPDETSKLNNTALTQHKPEWLQACKVIDLYYAVGLLVFTGIRLLPGHSGLDVFASIALTSTVFAFVLADLWSLHYRAKTFLTDALIPTLTISFACIAIWFVSPYAVMWVFASIPVLFVRLPLKLAYIWSVGALIIALTMLSLKHNLDIVILARLALAGGMISVTLGSFLKILNKVNRDLIETTEQLNSTLQSIPQGLTVIDENNRLTLFNQQFCDLLNLPRSFIARKPTLPEVVQYQIDRGDFRDPGDITPETRTYIFSRGMNVDEHVQRNYVRKDAKGRYIEVRTHPMPSGDRVRIYTDVSQYENAYRKLQELLAEHQKISQHVLQNMHQQIVESMTELAITRDNKTSLHIQRTKLYIQTLAQILRHAERYREQLSDSMIEKIILAAPLYDLGKIGIPDHILFKTDLHTEDETVIMQTHAMLGESILLAIASADREPSSLLNIAANMAGGHHENWDGSGYPRGRAGIDIPLEARLIALVDVYDSLTAMRIDKETWTQEAVHAEIFRLSGKKLDPDIVAAFGQSEERFREIAIEFKDANSTQQPVCSNRA